jgi:O-antigen/teichoic acid export membrane protein
MFALPFITPHLTKLDFGVYGLITAIAAGLAVLNTLGLNVVLSNSFYKSPGQYRWAWRQIYGFLILWNIPYALILATVLYFFIPFEAEQHTWGIIALNVLPIVVFGPTSVLGSLYYQLNQQPMQIAIRSIIIGFIAVGFNVYFIAGLGLGYMGWFLSACISQVLVQSSYYFPLRRKMGISPIFNFKWRFIKDKLKIALPIVPHFYAGYLLNTSDRVVMNLTGINTGNIGLYNAANTMGNLVQAGGLAAGTALGPLMFQAYKEKKEYVARHLVFVSQIMFLCGTFLISIWLKEIFIFLIRNETLRSVYPLGIILVMAYNYRPMYFGANNRVFYLEKTKVLLKITLVAGLSNVLLNLIFIPVFGYQTAAYTTFISLMYMGYSGFFLKVYKDHSTLPYYPIYWFLATLMLTIAAWYIVEWSTAIKVMASLLISAIGIILIVKMNRKNG